MNNILEIHDLITTFNTSRGPVKAVDGVSLAVKKGKITGIVGESGCGKSVTSFSVMKLLPSNAGLQGEVKFNYEGFEGKNLLEMSEKDMSALRGNQISMIFQEPMTSLNPVKKVGVQIGEALTVHKRGVMSSRDVHKKVIQMLDIVGVPESQSRADSYPHQLSGGLRQRAMIAMALICDPALLIADEPTTALDVTIQAQVLEKMKELQSRLGTSIMLITHDLGVVAQMCDYVYVMYAGQVVEHGDVFRIFDHPSHPYTKGLLKSIPSGGDHKGRLHSIAGTVPKAGSIPVGCRFFSRCDEAGGTCDKENFPLGNAGDEHFARCIQFQDIAGAVR